MKKIVMSVLTIGVLCTALISCSDDDNNNNTTTNPTENYSAYKSWNDFTNAQTKDYQEYPNLTLSDLVYRFDDANMAITMDNLAIYLYDHNTKKVYSSWVSSSRYNATVSAIILDPKTGAGPATLRTRDLNFAMNDEYKITTVSYFPQEAFDVKIVAYDKETNTFYEGTSTNEKSHDLSGIKLIKK